jgi:hypothetical protein
MSYVNSYWFNQQNNPNLLKTYTLGSWTTGSTPVSQYAWVVKYADSSLMSINGNFANATGTNPSILLSTDGGSNSTPIRITESGIGINLQDIIYAFGKWFAGRTTDNRLYTSTNRTTWTRVSAASLPTNFRGGGFAYSPTLNRLISVGVLQSTTTGYINYTDDGTNWTTVTLSGVDAGTHYPKAEWCGSLGKFIVSFATKYSTSSNGSSWSSLSSLGASSDGFPRLAWSNDLGILLRTGSGNIYYTKDLATWTTVTPPLGGQKGGVRWVPELGLFVMAASGSSDASTSNLWLWSRDGLYYREEATASSKFWRDIEFDPGYNRLVLIGRDSATGTTPGDSINIMNLTLTTPTAVEAYPTSLQDGGFENTNLSTAWTIEGDGPPASITSERINSVDAQPAKVGSRFMQAGGSIGTLWNKSVVSQLVSLTYSMITSLGTPKTFTLTWWQAGKESGETAIGWISVIWYDYQNRSIQVNSATPLSAKAWVSRTITATIPTNALYYRVEICSMDNGNGNNQYYDDLSVSIV